MKPTELAIRRKIKRRTEAINKLDVELVRYGEILAMMDEDNPDQKKIINRMRIIKNNIEEKTAEKKWLIQKLMQV